MAKQARKQPNHGDWFVEDQTRTDNGFRLLRYHAGTLNDEGIGWVQYPGWHEFGYFGDRTAAVKAQVQFETPDRMPNGDPWLASKGRDQL
jgi:hypothetical protein